MDGAPGILAGADHLVADADEVGGAAHGEGKVAVHGGVRLRHRLVVDGELVDLHTVGGQLRHDFGLLVEKQTSEGAATPRSTRTEGQTTLKRCSSGLEMVSALAMTGMMFTLLSSFFMHTRSRDFSLRGHTDRSSSKLSVHKSFVTFVPVLGNSSDKLPTLVIKP